MTDDQKAPVTPVLGYTPQSQERLDCVNHNKALEERLLRQIERYLSESLVDGRWAAIAKTHFEQGFMALNRSVMQPQRIALPEDSDPPANEAAN